MIVPHSPEIERAVVGQLLLEPGLLKKAGLKETDFHGEIFRRTYRAMQTLSNKGQGIDLPLLAEHMKPEDIQALSEVSSETFTVENFPSHLSRLKELSSKRSLEYLCLEIIRGIHEKDLGQSLLRVRQGLSSILDGQQVGSITGAEMAAHAWGSIEERAKKRGTLSGIPSGLKHLDDHLDGFQNSELTLIAGRPSQGKTAFALSILLSAVQAGFPGGFLSLEMGQGQVEHRLLSNLSGVPLWRIRKGFLGGEEWEKITSASSLLNALPVHFVFGIRSLKDITPCMINLAENQGAKILFLDYIQLARADGAQNREREISMISGELKSLAVSLKVPVIALSQLSRAPEKRDDRRPGLADLRDSGSLEQDADAVILLFREDINKAKGPVDFIIAKGRNTGGGTFTGEFDGECQRFSEPKRETPNE